MQNLILGLYVLTTSSALVVLKWGTQTGAPVSFADHRVAFNLSLPTVSGLCLYMISFFLYVYLISKHELGYIIPVTAAFVYVLIFFASFFIFKEGFGLLKIAGISLILGGLVLLQLGK